MYEVIAEMSDESDLHAVFNYMYSVHLGCLEVEKELKDECSESVIDSLELDKEMIWDCIDFSFEEPDNYDTENDLLREDRVSATDLGVQLNPTLTINGKIFHDDMRAEQIFAGICSAFEAKHRPEVCD